MFRTLNYKHWETKNMVPPALRKPYAIIIKYKLRDWINMRNYGDNKEELKTRFKEPWIFQKTTKWRHLKICRLLNLVKYPMVKNKLEKTQYTEEYNTSSRCATTTAFHSSQLWVTAGKPTLPDQSKLVQIKFKSLGDIFTDVVLFKLFFCGWIKHPQRASWERKGLFEYEIPGSLHHWKE